MRRLFLAGLLVWKVTAADFADHFEAMKKAATPAELYALMFALPKGGDLHHHNGLSIYASVWYREATAEKTLQRNSFYTLTAFGNCRGSSDALPRFYTIQRSHYEALTDCEKRQYQALASLPADDRRAWISSLMLDQPGEARDEFFEHIVPRDWAI